MALVFFFRRGLKIEGGKKDFTLTIPAPGEDPVRLVFFFGVLN